MSLTVQKSQAFMSLAIQYCKRHKSLGTRLVAKYTIMNAVASYISACACAMTFDLHADLLLDFVKCLLDSFSLLMRPNKCRECMYS